jgi:hypothetical protein
MLLYFNDLLYGLKCDVFWRKFHGQLRRMSILQLFEGILCRGLFGPFDLWSSLTLKFLCWFFFFLPWWSIYESRVLKLPTITVSGFTFLCLVVFVLWNWVQQHLVSIHLQSFYPFDELLPLLICNNLFTPSDEVWLEVCFVR